MEAVRGQNPSSEGEKGIKKDIFWKYVAIIYQWSEKTLSGSSQILAKYEPMRLAKIKNVYNPGFEDNTFAGTDTTDTNSAIIHILFYSMLHKVGGIYKHLRFLTSEFHFLLKNYL